MPVISAYNTATADGGFDAQGNRTYTEEWLVMTDDVNDHGSTVLVSPLLPQMFDLYLPGNSYDSGAYVNSKRARRDEGHRMMWHVTVGYSTAGASNKGRDGDGRRPDNPLDEPEVVTYRTGAEERVMEEAYGGVAIGAGDDHGITAADIAAGKIPVCNSAGEAYDPPYMKPEYFRIWTITRNEADYDEDAKSELIGTCNEAEFRGKRKFTMRLADIAAEEMRKAATVYHRVSYELHYNRKGWFVPALDAGFKVFDGGDLVPARDVNDARYGDPVLLDGFGLALDPGDDPVYWPYLQHDPADWSALNLDA